MRLTRRYLLVQMSDVWKMTNKAKHDMDWKALEDTLTLAQGTMGLNVCTLIILVSSSTLLPCSSGRVVFQRNYRGA